jgi:hypothetical protein
MVRCAMLLLLLVPLSWSQSLPDAPASTRVADKNFWSLTAANGAITLSDVLTTSLLVGNSSACPMRSVRRDSMAKRRRQRALPRLWEVRMRRPL